MSANQIQLNHKKEEAFTKVALALEGLQYGSVQIIVQDGVIVQIDRTEKVRIQAANKKNVNQQSG